MFTGIVEEVGLITEARAAGGDLRIRVAARQVTADLDVGASVAVSGCCLTATEVGPDGFSAELSRETVAKTAPRWSAGARVNLERAMAADGRFGGHMVSGHIEGVGEVLAVRREPGAFVVSVRAPERLARYLVPKGSVTVDGVSLTVVDAGGPGGSDPRLAPSEFTLWLIPHTLEATTLGELEPGSIVNLEADLVAKYLERLQLMKEPLNVP
jgi:riboflavin synthase